MIKSADDYLVYNRQGTFLTEKGYLVGLKMKLWQLPTTKEIDFPQGYKLSWIFLNLFNKKGRVLFDNHQGKPPIIILTNTRNFLSENLWMKPKKCFDKWFTRNLVILIMNNKIMKNKTFIFKYDPHFSPKQMFGEFKEAIRGRRYIQPENVMMANDLSVIHRIISKARLKVFACIKEYQPANIHQLAQLLQRDYTNVWRDCQVLANCGIIELKEHGKEAQPIVLYEQIVLDFPVNKEVTARRKGVGLSVQA